MLKKHNICLFIILLILISFYIFNNTLIETNENIKQDFDCDKPLTIKQSGKNTGQINAHNNSQHTSLSNSMAMKCSNFSKEDSIKELESKQIKK